MNNEYFRKNHRLDPKDLHAELRKNGTSDTSVYSTCSNGGSNDSNSSSLNKDNVRGCVQAVGQAMPNAKDPNVTLKESFFENDTSYAISPLDQNLDVLSESDIFMDCLDENTLNSCNMNNINLDEKNSKFNLHEDQSTEYIPFKPTLLQNISKTNANRYKNDSDQREFNVGLAKSNISSSKSSSMEKSELDGLRTVLDESTVIRAATTSTSPNNISKTLENTGKYLVDLANEINSYHQNSTKIFSANEADLSEDASDKKQSKYTKNNSRLQDGTSQYNICRRTDDNCNQNTTESFIFWEKQCELYENSSLRSSLSDLSTTNDYDGDNEHSSIFKSLDDTYLSNYSRYLMDEERIVKKRSMYRSKSCESFLREAKHLPHVLCDKFLKYLATEIKNMRKQKVYCTCSKTFEKPHNKENNEKSVKNCVRKTTLKLRNCGNATDRQLLTKKLLLDPATNGATLLSLGALKNTNNNNSTRLSPEIVRNSSYRKATLSPDLLKVPSDLNNVQRLNSRSPNKSSITPTHKHKLVWQKEIVSPVGEYIKGRNPFKNSPNKKHL
ncbi:uncharacterized protein LOC106646731 [Copidosoma floridanum]|uniref:uncharacterized protein LOC106646731 n=1 Tax=Copidosoma floridanum TaxID=29053 RepID=UPI0006C9B380|nr:uncharacterized protein LOC106646731 [Copidosoma floridanum]